MILRIQTILVDWNSRHTRLIPFQSFHKPVQKTKQTNLETPELLHCDCPQHWPQYICGLNTTSVFILAIFIISIVFLVFIIVKLFHIRIKKKTPTTKLQHISSRQQKHNNMVQNDRLTNAQQITTTSFSKQLWRYWASVFLPCYTTRWWRLAISHSTQCIITRLEQEID